LLTIFVSAIIFFCVYGLALLAMKEPMITSIVKMLWGRIQTYQIWRIDDVLR